MYFLFFKGVLTYARVAEYHRNMRKNIYIYYIYIYRKPCTHVQYRRLSENPYISTTYEYLPSHSYTVFCSVKMCYADIQWTCYSKFFLSSRLLPPKSKNPVTVPISELWALLFAYKRVFLRDFPLTKLFFALSKKSVDSHPQTCHTHGIISMGTGTLSSKPTHHPS